MYGPTKSNTSITRNENKVKHNSKKNKDNSNNDIDRGVIKKVDMAKLQLPRHTNSTTTNSSSISNSIPQTNKVVKGTTNSIQNNKNNSQNDDVRSMKKTINSNNMKQRKNKTNSEISKFNNTIVKSIENLRKATDVIDRQDIVNIASNLHIPLKKGAVKVENTELSKKAGNNKKPSIVTITELFDGITDSNAIKFRQNAIDTALELFRNTLVPIKDTYTIAEINKNGIEKTFSGSVTESKVQTANNIRKIIEEGIYIYSTQDTSDKDAILYHNFFTPINYKEEKGLIRVVIKEYTKNKTMNDKYYYHQLEYIDNKKIEGSLGTLPHDNMEVRHFKPSPSINTSIPQNSEDVNSTKKTDTEEGLTNAERADAYIEQEIKKIEKSGEWDDTIPATKMTNIRKMIEDYLGINIQRSHFKQQAFAIYKNNRDVIRTKELSDMDSILHETGHALDLGKRINIDKESIADELLTAINQYGGYENESRSVKLDEGFAEILREYAIIPERAKADYPQTVAVIDGIRQNDKEFNTFMTNLQKQIYNYIHQNPRNREFSRQSVGEQTDKKPWSKERVKQTAMRAIWDRDYAIKEAVEKQAKAKGMKMQDIEASKNAYYLVRLTNGMGDRVTSFLADGYIDENGKRLTPGLSKIGEILGDDPERYNDLRVYLVAKRDVEYKAKSLKTGLRSMDTKAVLEQFKNDTQIQKAAQVIYDTLDGVLQYAVDNHLISQEEAKSLRESNAFYVPMQRVLENRGNQVGRRGAVSDIIKARTGSDLDIKDVLENIIVNSANIIQQVENNKILNALFEEGESSGLKGTVYDVIDTPMKKIGTANLDIWEGELKRQGVDTDNLDLNKAIDLFSPNNKINTQERITSFINKNGKRIYLQFYDDVIFNSIMGIDSNGMSKILKISSFLNMPLRYGATMANIGFAIPNMISDTAQASIYSTAGFVPVVDNALGVLGVLASTNKTVKSFLNQVAPEYVKRINYIYTLYNQTGATNSTRLSQYRETTQNIMKDVYGTKNSEMLGIHEKFKPLNRLLDLMTYIPELSEQSTRFRVFERNYNYYKDKGNSETDARIMAALEARDATQDFSRTGNVTREINQIIPFSAARVGSAYTFAEKVKANPKQVGMRIAILTALAIAIKAIGYDDKEIEELVQRKKDDNFVLKVGDKVVTIKKPQGILRSMINLAEYIQDLATGHIEEGKEGERLAEWINNAIMDNMPADEVTGLVPNAVAPLIENAINKDFYYNTDIVKSYDLDLPDSEQYYDYNSQVAIWLGKIFNYSPAKIDNLISGYFGGLGTQVTNVTDWLSGTLGLSAQEPNMGAEDNAIGKRFIVNVNTNSESLDEIYDRKTELTKKKNGGTITSEEEQELETITSAISNISSINKQIKAIKADLTMSSKEKAELIRPLQEQKTDTARKALGKDLIYENNEEKIQSTQFYPIRSSLSQSGYTLELTEEMKKEYETLAYNKYKQYEKQGLYSQEKLEELKSKCKDYAKSQLMQKYRNQLVRNK